MQTLYTSEGCLVNSANDFVFLFRDMLGKIIMHISKRLHFTFKILPNTVQKKQFPCSVTVHSVGPSRTVGLISY